MYFRIEIKLKNRCLFFQSLSFYCEQSFKTYTLPILILLNIDIRKMKPIEIQNRNEIKKSNSWHIFHSANLHGRPI